MFTRCFISLIMIVLLSGCWDEIRSEKQLISPTLASNPVESGRYLLLQLQFEEGDELEEILYEDRTSGKYIFQKQSFT